VSSAGGHDADAGAPVLRTVIERCGGLLMDLVAIKMLVLAGLTVVFVLTIWLSIWLFGVDHQPAPTTEAAKDSPAEPEPAEPAVREAVTRGR
jgi:hypothetical protein